jgi:hypothetical protein
MPQKCFSISRKKEDSDFSQKLLEKSSKSYSIRDLNARLIIEYSLSTSHEVGLFSKRSDQKPCNIRFDASSSLLFNDESRSPLSYSYQKLLTIKGYPLAFGPPCIDTSSPKV